MSSVQNNTIFQWNTPTKVIAAGVALLGVAAIVAGVAALILTANIPLQAGLLGGGLAIVIIDALVVSVLRSSQNKKQSEQLLKALNLETNPPKPVKISVDFVTKAINAKKTGNHEDIIDTANDIVMNLDKALARNNAKKSWSIEELAIALGINDSLTHVPTLVLRTALSQAGVVFNPDNTISRDFLLDARNDVRKELNI